MIFVDDIDMVGCGGFGSKGDIHMALERLKLVMIWGFYTKMQEQRITKQLFAIIFYYQYTRVAEIYIP